MKSAASAQRKWDLWPTRWSAPRRHDLLLLLLALFLGSAMIAVFTSPPLMGTRSVAEPSSASVSSSRHDEQDHG
jgi:hypothetical protein